ncbi:hypothetical protein MKUB_32430 [Mycobacterium kubicae]|uniref:Secreted protein n=3 Tax=Mycobacterium kubicae TaxID=120959 RepID=A0ABQ1BPW1_9MYCO|nr:hypothetical protein MKUB_32430 [Mycobacterium kubicae]
MKWVRQMRGLKRMGKLAVATAMAACLGTWDAGFATAAPDGSATRVALRSVLRHCDYGASSVAPQIRAPALGGGMAMVRTAGSSVIADVHLIVQNQPGTRYDVGLIQAPLPSSVTCGPGDPGTAFTSLVTDESGQGNATVTAPIRPGQTGTWIWIARPAENSQNPAEVYTSDFVVPV